MIKDRLKFSKLSCYTNSVNGGLVKGVVDLIKMKAVIWKDGSVQSLNMLIFQQDLKEQADKYRKELIETAVEQDEKLMDDYLNGKQISEKDIIACVRKRLFKFDFVPVLTGSAFKIKGVQPLLDAVIDFLPSPKGHWIY